MVICENLSIVRLSVCVWGGGLLIVATYAISHSQGCCLASVRMTKSQQSLARLEPEPQITYINLSCPWNMGNGNHQTENNWGVPRVSGLKVGSLVLCLSSGLH